MRTASFLAAATLATLGGMTGLAAQTVETHATPAAKPRWELLVPTGAVVPTGAQRDAIKRANLSAVQLSYVPRPALAVTAMAGWARTRDLATANDPKLDVFMYDVGAELRAPRWIGRGATTFMPFAGVGVGARSYNYRSLDVDATHNAAGYASLGGELGVRRVRLRLEARDYVTGFTPLAGGGAADARNDVAVMAGLRFTRR